MNWTGQITSSDQGLIIDDETGRNIAVAYDPKHTSLIESAPDLLKALKAARQWHNGDKWRDGCTADQRAAWEAHRDMMDAVIAKATGEQA
jgi:hypothetical protein